MDDRGDNDISESSDLSKIFDNESQTLGAEDSYTNQDSDGASTVSGFSNNSNVSDMKNMMGNLAFDNNDGDSSTKGSASTMMQNDNKKPAARKCCVTLNKSKSELSKFFHIMSPDSVIISSENVAWTSMKFAPVFKDRIDLNIHENGRKANLRLDMPSALQDPNNLLGENLEETHVLYQSIAAAINSRRARKDSKDHATIGLKLPFRAEAQTSDDVFGPGTGQSAGYVPIIQKSKHPGDKTLNACFVFKEEGSSFKVKTSVKSKVFDNTIQKKPSSGHQQGSVRRSQRSRSQLSVTGNNNHGSGAGTRAGVPPQDEVPLPMDIHTSDAPSQGTRGSKKKRTAEKMFNQKPDGGNTGD